MIDDDEQYEDFTSGAPLESKFSDRYLRLTDDFCCNNGNIKLIRWIGCKPGVYNGSTTLFLSNDLALCNWSQQITNYNYTTISFSPGGFAELSFSNVLYIYGKATWSKKASNISLRNLEVGISQQGGVVGSTIPFPIESPSPVVYNYQLVRELFEINTSAPINNGMVFNNTSPYSVSLSLLYAY